MVRPATLLACVQLFFTLSWTVYVVYLPELLASVGLAGAAPFVLVADQVVFIATDLALGAYADRTTALFERFGRTIAVVTLVSSVAFAFVPFGTSKIVLLAAVFVWATASAALRVPPMVLLGRVAGPKAGTRAATAYALGIGIAGAFAPYLQLVLKGTGPRLPFALASVAVVVTTLALVRALSVAGATPTEQDAPEAEVAPASPHGTRAVARVLLVAVAAAALAFQVHFALRSANVFLRHAPAPSLAKLMPVYWIGFNLAIVPVARVLALKAPLRVLVVAGAVGSLASLLFERAPSLALAVTCQLFAGAAWAAVFFGGLAGCAALGRTGREGRLVGRFFALLAAAALLRIALVAAGVDKAPRVAAALPNAPTVAWAVVVIALVAVAWRTSEVRPT